MQLVGNICEYSILLKNFRLKSEEKYKIFLYSIACKLQLVISHIQMETLVTAQQTRKHI